jgi:formyltetrahydrofolate hydrolase
MINYETQFERMDKEYDKLYEKYYKFKENTNCMTRKSLVMQIKKFTKCKNDLMASLKQLKLKMDS